MTLFLLKKLLPGADETALAILPFKKDSFQLLKGAGSEIHETFGEERNHIQAMKKAGGRVKIPYIPDIRYDICVILHHLDLPPERGLGGVQTWDLPESDFDAIGESRLSQSMAFFSRLRNTKNPTHTCCPGFDL